MEGTIARLLLEKGFGFIKEAETGREFFFHRSSCRGFTFETLKEGFKVEFDEEASSKGPRAANVRPS